MPRKRDQDPSVPTGPRHNASDVGPREDSARLSRRAFIKGAGAAAAVASLIGVPAAGAASPSEESGEAAGAGILEQCGPGAKEIELRINGAVRQLLIEPRVTLLEALRGPLGLTGTKLVCDRGACGACTVHLDGAPVNACMMLAIDARGHEIITIEGLGTPGRMHPVQRAFVEHDALQCGFCTPGMVMSVTAALAANPAPTLDDVKHAVAGNICRCGTYPHVFKAALAAAAKARSIKPEEGA
jgi:xanthine dehydrogenase YagT iron-sulfur-binding subunit